LHSIFKIVPEPETFGLIPNSIIFSKKKHLKESDENRKYYGRKYKILYIAISLLFVFSSFMHAKIENGWMK
jgi:hypothetical protein